MAQRLTLAVAQGHTLSSTAETLAALSQTVRKAADAGVELILFPEAYLGGYPRGTNFGCSIGARTDVGREQFRQHFQDAIDLGDTPRGAGAEWIYRRIGRGDLNALDSSEDGKNSSRGDGTREELERISRETGVFIVTGLIERAGGSLYCAVVYVEPQRGCIGKRRKVMPTGTERLVWAQGSTSTLRAVKTTIKGAEITLAAAVCWENYMPLLRASLYSQNVNIYLAPTADGRDTWLPLLRTIALEGRTFVLSSNQCIRENDLPSWIRKPDTASATNGDHQPQHSRNLSDGSSKYPAGQDQRSRKEIRRNSIVTRTNDNHEITWPSPGSKSPVVSGRRPSITVPEGPHEVCLPALSHQHSAPAGPVPRPTAPEQLSKLAEENGLGTLHSPFVSHGGSCIVGPNGDVLAGPLWDDTDGLLTVQVDLEECIRGRLDFDCAGSYSRSDSFELKVKDLDLDPP